MIWDIAMGVMLGLALDRILTTPSRYRNKDDTDPRGWWRSSGLRVYTDHKTGLQYIGSALGGLTPRLDRGGKHMQSPSEDYSDILSPPLRGEKNDLDLEGRSSRETRGS